jgi:hypothetical protein
VGWVAGPLGEFMWSKQRTVAELVRDNRYVAVPSCHDSGKSFTASRLASWWLDVHPPGEAFVVTTAPTTAQVDSDAGEDADQNRSAGTGVPAGASSGLEPWTTVIG